MKKIIIESIYYNEARDKLKKDISKLLSKVYDDTSYDENSIKECHRKELNAKSFYCYNNGELIAYAGVIQKTINHFGTTFNIAGISSVATDIDFRLQGVGNTIVREATEWIKNNKNIDFGIFTCNPSLANFYKSAGDWAVEKNTLLIGSLDSNAITSKKIDAVVLMRLFSEKAIKNKYIILGSTINLDFPVGEFL